MRVEWVKPGDEQRVVDAAELFDRPPTLNATRAYVADSRNYLLLAILEDGDEDGNSEGRNSEGRNSGGRNSEGRNSEGRNSEGRNSEGRNSEGRNSEQGDVGQAVGFVHGTALARLDGPEQQMLLYEIAVDPAYQRRGIAKALIAALERICRDEGFAEMFVFTNRSNEAAMRLYASTGGRIEADDEQMFVWTYLEGFKD